MDVSESEKTKEEASSEDCTPELKNKLHFQDAAGNYFAIAVVMVMKV